MPSVRSLDRLSTVHLNRPIDESDIKCRTCTRKARALLFFLGQLNSNWLFDLFITLQRTHAKLLLVPIIGARMRTLFSLADQFLDRTFLL